MISIVFAVPYPQMRQQVLDAFAAHPMRNKLRETIKVVHAEQLSAQTLTGSITIARGMTYHKIVRQHPDMPCVEVKIHTADILRALLDAKKRYNPRKIALVGFFPHLPAPESLRAFVGCDIDYYANDSVDPSGMPFTLALSEGCDAFVGGYTVCLWAQDNGYPSSLVASTDEEIREALDEAVRTYEIFQRSEMFRIALENTREPVLYIDEGECVGYVNPSARRLLVKLGLGAAAEGRALREALPFFRFPSEYRAGAHPAFENELYDCDGTGVTVSCSPVRVGQVPAGAVLAVNTVETIRDREYSIRRKQNKKGLRARYTFNDIIYRSDVMRRTVEKAKKCAMASSNLMLIGETGTGKELFAQSIHNYSARKDGPFVAVNCAALPEHLIESELFGYAEGAFTGARRGGKMGLMETAHGGTLFLDEVSELPPAVQGKLLRALQEHDVRRVGDDKVISVDVRVISASNATLPARVEEGRFRSDLLYRLDVLNLVIPSLRRRSEDIPGLFVHYMRQYEEKYACPPAALSPAATAMLMRHPFEGNVRELRNLAERLVVLFGGGPVGQEEMRECLNRERAVAAAPVPAPPFSDAAAGGEAEAILDALRRAGYNRSRAAEALGVNRSTLWRKMRRLGIG